MNEHAPAPSRRPVRRALLGAALLSGVLIAACEGTNAWKSNPTGPSGNGAGDGDAPTVEILVPDSAARVAIGDSAYVQVRVTDEEALDSLFLSGAALRGDAEIGTRDTVARFLTRSIGFSRRSAVVDTTLTRWLLATPDTADNETVYLVATALDAAGNVTADTVRITIGGPRLNLNQPVAGAQVRAGTRLAVRLSAVDRGGTIRSLAVHGTASGYGQTATLALEPALSEADTVLYLDIPSSVRGDLTLRATLRTASNDSAATAPVVVSVIAPTTDEVPPTVTFSASPAYRPGELVPAREWGDTISVQVSAQDSSGVDSVGVTILPIRRFTTGTDTLPAVSLRAAGNSHLFQPTLRSLGVPQPTGDLYTLRLEVTAVARDAAGNCAAATVPGRPISESCSTVGSAVFSSNPGARVEVQAVRGTTVPVDTTRSRIADIASNGTRVFFSDVRRDQIDVMRVGESAFSDSVRIGNQPWGLAFNPAGNRLYIANSGATYITRLDPATLQQVDTLQTPNQKVFDVAFTTDSAGVQSPTSVTAYDYSDRIQQLAVTQNGNVVYSTKPTGAAPNGTVRVLHASQHRVEVVTSYLENRPGSKLLIVNADSAFLVAATPNVIEVCPRPRSENPAYDKALPKQCFVGDIGTVAADIAAAHYDTEFLYNRDISELGLGDTTFVAVSGDHSAVAVGEGSRDRGRVMLLFDPAGTGNDPLVKTGEISDEIRNRDDRVTGLALNRDASVGLARGSSSYFFDRNLRLQGVAATGIARGGVAMHPNDPTVNRAFISGVDQNGLAYVDVYNTNERGKTLVNRVYTRDPIVGALRAVATASGVSIYAVTTRGVVVLNLTAADMGL